MKLRSDWNNIAVDGFPPDSSGEQFFCWSAGWSTVVILDHYVNGSSRGFCNSGGAWHEVTHWKSIDYPTPPPPEE